MNEEIFNEACRLWKTEAFTVSRLTEVVNPEAFCQVTEALTNTVISGGRLLFIGKGDSAIAARKTVHTLCSLDIPAMFLNVGEGRHATLGLLRPGDMLILISKAGSAEELIQLIEPAREKGIRVLGITQNPASVLGMKCDLLLRVMVARELGYDDIAGNVSTIALTAILDAVCTCTRKRLDENR